MELTKALIHDFYRRVAEHRLEVLAPKGSKKRLLQEEEFALFHRFMSGDLSEEEKALAADGEAEALTLLVPAQPSRVLEPRSRARSREGW